MVKLKIFTQLTIPVKCMSFLAMCVWILGLGQALKVSTTLERMNINRDFVTLSGFSSGGTFAQQMYFSHSSLIRGIGVFSHSYYRCGPIANLARTYDAWCTTVGNPSRYERYDPNLALRDIQNYFNAGLIDDPRYMANKPLYVFAGTQNYLFTTEMSLRILYIFERFVKNRNAVRVQVYNANLTLPSDRPDLPSCGGPVNAIAVSNCGLPGALDSLQFLLGTHVVQRRMPHVPLQPLIAFDQTEFFYGVQRHDMDSVGFMYIPTVCKNTHVKCFLHFYFHGCMTGREFVGVDHIMNSGYLEVAEENGIIMIFPQVISHPVENRIGCWDTYGFTGPLYATKKGGQVRVVRNMLARILGQDGVFTTGIQNGLTHPPRTIQTYTSSTSNAIQNLYQQHPISTINPNPYGFGRSERHCTGYLCTVANYF